MGQPASTPRKPLLVRAALGAGGAIALLSLTATPTPKTLARLSEAGVPAEAGGLILHVAPVVFAMLLVSGAMLLTRGRSTLIRSVILAVAGGFVGFFMAMCLDLFSGALPALERITGPLQEASGLDVVAWSLAVLSIIYGVFTAAVAGFGTSAVQAINFENVDEETIEVRPRDRGMFVRSSVGLIGQGVFVGALAVLHQMSPETGGAMRGGAVVALALGALAFTWSSWVIWREMDELLRRTVVEAYAWSGIFATVGCLVWAVLEALKVAPPLTAYAAIVLLIFVQTFATFFIAAGFGSPAAKHAGAKG